MSALLRVCLLSAVLSASPALAGSPADVATADALFRDGMALFRAKQYAKACPKLAESQRLDPAFGTQFHLAECYEKLGKIASAWGLYTDVALQTRRAGQTKRAAKADARATALAPRVSRVRIEVSHPVEGLNVRRGKVSLPQPQWGSALPTNPGVYPIEATAPGHGSYRSEITVKTEGQTLTVKIPALQKLSAPDPRPADPPPDERGGGLSSQAIAGFAIGGVGVAGLAVGLGLSVMAKLDHADSLSSSHCVNDAFCDDEGQGLIADAQQLETIGTVVMAASGAVAAAGLVVWLTAPAQDEPQVGVRLMPNGSFRLTGRW